MDFPILQELQTSRSMTQVFGGYNHNTQISEGEFFDMRNMTSDYYPLAATRSPRGTYLQPEKASGLISKDSLCFVDGSEFVINEYRVDMGLSDEPKTMVSMGAYVIILPDKKYINTANLEDYGDIEASVTVSEGVNLDLCRINGELYEDAVRSPTAPEEPDNMALWIDTSSTPNALKQFSANSGMWVTIATTYVKISAAGIGAGFEQHDGVEISGMPEDLDDFNGSFVIWEKDADYIVITGMLPESKTISEPVTISRSMPEMDFVIESGNRLWGCRYGVTAEKDVVNEIYASKLGDFKNWSCFMGISTDSYTVSLGSDGQFTGAITHLGYPLFFKETCLHKVYGTMPSNYQVQTTACRGVQKGSGKSLAIVNEVLYYKAPLAVCAYDGSLPREISSALGEVYYTNAVGGGHGNKYFVSMSDPDGQYSLFAYDSAKGIWHKEDDTQVKEFCSSRNMMYYLDSAGTIKYFGGDDATPIQWMLETGIIGVDSPDQKYLSKVTLRMSMDTGSTMQVYAQYDSEQQWHPVATITAKSLRSFTVPIRPRRCDHLRLKMEGTGAIKLFSIAKTIENGSDVCAKIT